MEPRKISAAQRLEQLRAERLTDGRTSPVNMLGALAHPSARGPVLAAAAHQGQPKGTTAALSSLPAESGKENRLMLSAGAGKAAAVPEMPRAASAAAPAPAPALPEQQQQTNLSASLRKLAEQTRKAALKYNKQLLSMPRAPTAASSSVSSAAAASSSSFSSSSSSATPAAAAKPSPHVLPPDTPLDPIDVSTADMTLAPRQQLYPRHCLPAPEHISSHLAVHAPRLEPELRAKMAEGCIVTSDGALAVQLLKRLPLLRWTVLDTETTDLGGGVSHFGRNYQHFNTLTEFLEADMPAVAVLQVAVVVFLATEGADSATFYPALIYSSLVQPLKPVTAQAEAVHGISAERARKEGGDAALVCEATWRLLEWSPVIIGFNVWFDLCALLVCLVLLMRSRAQPLASADPAADILGRLHKIDENVIIFDVMMFKCQHVHNRTALPPKAPSSNSGGGAGGGSAAASASSGFRLALHNNTGCFTAHTGTVPTAAVFGGSAHDAVVDCMIIACSFFAILRSHAVAAPTRDARSCPLAGVLACKCWPRVSPMFDKNTRHIPGYIGLGSPCFADMMALARATMADEEEEKEEGEGGAAADA